LTASYLALGCGVFYFVYALKYYASGLIALGVFNMNLQKTEENHPAQRILAQRNIEYRGWGEPFVSVHLPFFNELNVARRILEACLDIDYENFEVMVADDSRDATIEVLKEKGWRHGSPVFKFVHRRDRSGYKGGALEKAIEYMHPLTEYVVVFDADFVPPSNILRQFIAQWGLYGDGEKPVACVQGYQLHYLNRNENWITKGVRAEFSGSYMVERLAEEVYGGMKMVSGSVFMFDADLMRRLGWEESITEDWVLTLRLYLEGYRVVYTPLIQAPAEIPTSISRLVRQRMRWAEGHTAAVRKYFTRVLRSDRLSLTEKAEFVYFAPYYLQSLVFIFASTMWIVAELGKRHPPFWNQTLGWFLILSNFFAVPFMGLVGLFLEGDLRQDFSGVFSFTLLSYIICPYQAYAALKGLLGFEESNWVRTLKTGHVTDTFLGVKFRSLFEWLVGQRLIRSVGLGAAGFG
jgi:cellulose synthase/poly-beta-1,6-N-acetylglucosamine synthase-like glycosyltransferase